MKRTHKRVLGFGFGSLLLIMILTGKFTIGLIGCFLGITAGPLGSLICGFIGVILQNLI